MHGLDAAELSRLRPSPDGGEELAPRELLWHSAAHSPWHQGQLPWLRRWAEERSA